MVKRRLENCKNFEKPKFSDKELVFNLQDLMYTTLVKKNAFTPWLKSERGEPLDG